MEYFDIRKMPVNLWRNGAGKRVRFAVFRQQHEIFTGGRVSPPLQQTVNFHFSRV